MDAPIARTSLGDLRGAWHDGIAAFRGVPYASPPVGERRFIAAQSGQGWSGLRDATRDGPIAPQLPSRLRVAMGDFERPQDEDCLTLTICTPAPDAKVRPVLVWLHGGAWISGAGSLDWYDGANLARDGDIVVVGVNYRLGALGWLHRPGIIDVEPGTSDMIAALNWVRDHIAAFGGDPRCVTVMGQSAGATSIGRLLMLPEARPLFHRAIMQSGGFGRGAYTSEMATERADHYLHALGIDPQTNPPFMPVLPRAMTQAEMLGAIADGADGKPVLVGATADEVHAFFAADPAMQHVPADKLVARFGSDTALASYRARRPGASAMDLLADLGSDETFVLPATRLAEAIAGRGGTAYAYLFDWAPPGSRFRSCHCIDLPFVFGTFAAWAEAPMLAGGDQAQMADLSAAMQRAWIAFVHTGDPRQEYLSDWPPYNATERPTMRFGARVGVAGAWH
jgi:para-nitrobenzyl esterase